MPESRVPDPTLMARLQLSVKGVDWAASLVAHRQHEQHLGQWSAHQNLWHLVEVETLVFQPRIERILREERPTFARWRNDAEFGDDYPVRRDITELAEQFMSERAKTVETLKALTPEQWLRTGHWPDGREVDLGWVAEHVLAHALDHFVTLLTLHGDMEPLQARRWMAEGP